MTLVAAAIALNACSFVLQGKEVEVKQIAIVSEACPYREAADELVKHLQLVCGGSWSPATNAVLTLVLGEKPTADGCVKPFTSSARLIGDRIYLWGDDAADRRGRMARPGTLFAVYGFLREILGVRWVIPGDEGIVFSKTSTLRIPDDWSWSYTPALVDASIRGGKDPKGPGRYDSYAPKVLRPSLDQRKKNAMDVRMWKLRLGEFAKAHIPFGHAFTKWNARYHDSHPEYLALQKDGQRGSTDFKGRGSKYMKLCVSNEDVVDEIVREYVAAGAPKYWNICENDGKNFCRCDKCRALDEPRTDADMALDSGAHLTDRYLNFWNRIAKKIVAIRPDAVLCTYAYSDYREPPRRERVEFPDNMIFGMVPSQEDDNLAQIRAWKQAGMKHFKLRPNYLCYRGSLPRGYERFFLENFKANFREGMIGADYDAGLRDELMAFEAYAVARAIQDPEVSFETVEAEFVSQFGKAAPLMKNYFARIRERGEKALFAAQARRAGKSKGAVENVLDDSMLFGTVFAANPREELERDLVIARDALAAEGLSDLERLRVRRYALLSEHAIKAHDFQQTSDGYKVCKPDMVEKGLDLLDFRIKIAPYFPRANWGGVFRAFPFEVRWWMAKELKNEVKKRYPEMNHAK